MLFIRAFVAVCRCWIVVVPLSRRLWQQKQIILAHHASYPIFIDVHCSCVEYHEQNPNKRHHQFIQLLNHNFVLIVVLATICDSEKHTDICTIYLSYSARASCSFFFFFWQFHTLTSDYTKRICTSTSYRISASVEHIIFLTFSFKTLFHLSLWKLIWNRNEAKESHWIRFCAPPLCTDTFMSALRIRIIPMRNSNVIFFEFNPLMAVKSFEQLASTLAHCCIIISSTSRRYIYSRSIKMRFSCFCRSWHFRDCFICIKHFFFFSYN